MKQSLKDPWLILLLAIGAVLVFANLDNIYLWQDEAETALLSKNILRFGFPRTFDGTNLVDAQIENRSNYAWVYHPWFGFYLSAFFFFLMGQTTLAARLPFAIFGFSAIPVVYLLAKRLTDSKAAARLATLLLVCSVPFLLHVRQCRWYALTMFFTPLLLLAYLDFAECKKHSSLKLIVVSFFLFYSNHGVFMAVFGGVCIHYLFYYYYRRSRKIKEVLTPLAIIALLTLPWMCYSISWQHFTFLYTKGWEREPFRWDHLRQNLEFYFRVVNKYIVPVVFLGIVALFRLIRFKINPFSAKTVKGSSIWLILLVVFSSVLLLLFVDQRFLRYISHLFSLLLILEAIILLDWWRSSKLVTGLVIAVIIFTNLFNNPKLKFYLADYLYEITHDYDGPSEGVVKYLKQNAQPGQVAKMPIEVVTLMFYTGLKLENTTDFHQETYPDWIILRRDWIWPRFWQSDYFKRIEKDYQKVVIDYPDIRFENRPDLGFHKFRTVKDAPRVTIYKKTKRE